MNREQKYRADLEFYRVMAELLELGLIDTAVVDGKRMVWFTPEGEKTAAASRQEHDQKRHFPNQR
jgi:hypothetical protein